MRKMMIAAAIAAATATTPAIGQIGNSQGLISVQIQNVDILNNFLNDAQIAALNEIGIPITVQAPISVAANVCDTTVALLAEARKAGDNTCTATSGSAALARVVQRQKLRQNR